MFSKGYGAINDEIKNMEAQREARKNEAYKFWLKSGESREVTFLEEEPTVFYEHRFQEGDDWRNAVVKVCIKHTGQCPGCDAGNKRQVRGAFTIVDFTPWEDKQTGKTHKSQKKLLILNANQADKLSKIGKVKGYRVSISRGTDPKDSKTGSAFVKCMKDDTAIRYELEDFAKRGVDVVPFNYSQVIKVDTYEEFKRFVKPESFVPDEHAPAGFDSKPTTAANQAPAPTDDDVPF